MARRFLIEARNRAVAFENGQIIEPDGRFDVVLSFPDGEVLPGLINAHDHLHRNHYGRLGNPPYEDTRAWARDVVSRSGGIIDEGLSWPRLAALLAGAWKNLFAGVTTVVHHDPWEPDFETGFPIRVVRVACIDSIEMATDLSSLQPGERFCLHLSESIGPDAAHEVRTLAAQGLLNARLIAVHCIGMDDHACDLFRQAGAALTWCPSSNIFLFGRTAPSRLFEQGIDVLLGSDSLLSGDGDLLDELRFARRLKLMGDDRLEAAVGDIAARRLGIALPRLEPGDAADLAVFACPPLEASAKDVSLVVVGGEPRVAHPDIGRQLEATGVKGEAMTLRGVSRWVSAGSPDIPLTTGE